MEARWMGAALTAADATSHGWTGINWRQVHQNVYRLQSRIVKAMQEGNKRRGRALQIILTRSLSGAVLAVRRVTENRGGKTAGVDGEIWDSPTKKFKAVNALRKSQYRAQPLRRIYIPKKNGKKRPLGIPCMIDRAKQAQHLLALDPVAECLADPNSYGFRRERSTADAIGPCFIALARKNSHPWILEGDIRACFDMISHEWLLEHVDMDKKVLAQWLKAGYMEGKELFPTRGGTPQGGIASPVLANLTLDGLESELRKRFKNKAKVNFIRYADDFVITSASKELLENQVKPAIEQFLKPRGLELSAEKTLVTHIRTGFDFLGQNVRKYGDKLLINPSRRSVNSLLEKVRHILGQCLHAPPENLIWTLNPIIRGWGNYHRHVVSKKIFAAIDNTIWHALWRWARRRHPNKSYRWIISRYFTSANNHRTIFTAKDQKGRPIHLFQVASIPIRRHVKIRANANPYDPAYEQYFKERLAAKRQKRNRGRKTDG